MDERLPIRPSLITGGEYSQISAPPSQKSDPVQDVGMLALSEQKNSIENLKTPLKKRRLSQVLPLLSGRHPVGRSREIIIEVPVMHKANCNKKIGIEIFAPIRKKHMNKGLFEMTDYNFKRIKGMREQDIKNEGKEISTPSSPELNEKQKQTLRTHSSDHLDPVEILPIKTPIIIFSHGLGLDPTVYRPLVEELASHGIIVLNVNHPASSSHAPFSEEALNVEMWDELVTSAREEYEKKVENEEKLNEIYKKIDILGTVGKEASNIQILSEEIRNGKDKLDEIYKKMDILEEDMVAKESNNIQFIIEEIRSGNLSGLPKDCGNENPIILAGHSLGGTVSMIVARDNPNLAGCINLDGRLSGKDPEKRTEKLKVPTLLFFIERGKEENQEIDQFLENNLSSAQEVIKGVEHNDFTIYPIIDWVAGGNRLDKGIKAYTESSKAMLNFMEKLSKK